MSYFIISPSQNLSGDITLPGDKSISHRSVILGAIAKGETVVKDFLMGTDTLATVRAFREMGVNIVQENNNLIIRGVGLFGLCAPKAPIDLGNSGTAMRLVAGLLSAQHFSTKLIGDTSLSRRPMNRVIKPLCQMGARIDSNKNMPPLYIHKNRQLSGIYYNMPIASAQVKSAILLAGLYANSPVCVCEKLPTRDHTERMLAGFGASIVKKNQCITLQQSTLSATEIIVPADISSAAFFMLGASIAKGGQIKLNAVNINPTRTGVIDILCLMGGNIRLTNKRELAGELLADIEIKPAQLSGIHIPEHLVPLAIDEFPAILIAAALAKGETVLTGAKELRVKESDRLHAVAEGLAKLSIKTEILPDGIIITGGEFQVSDEIIDSYGDHRIAMAFAMAGLRTKGTFSIRNCDNVQTSFPNFAQIARKAGLDIKTIS